MADRHRLAILGVGPIYEWSQDLADSEAKNVDKLLRVLRSSPLLTEVRFLPSLLVPEKRQSRT